MERVMISLERPGGCFNYRVVGVIVHTGHVLLHQAEIDDFWAPPGGRCELGETSAQALVRELREEMGEVVRVGRLLWVVENFYDTGGQRHHGLGLYYRVALPPDSPHLDIGAEFFGDEEGLRLTFRWFPLAALAGLRLYPVFLRSALTALPRRLRHIINDERAMPVV